MDGGAGDRPGAAGRAPEEHVAGKRAPGAPGPGEASESAGDGQASGGTPASGAGQTAGSPPPRRARGRRVVRLSAADQRRLEAGEISDPVEALHASGEPAQGRPAGRPGREEAAEDAGGRPREARPARPAGQDGAAGAGRGPGPDDERYLRDLPPHWGRH